MVIIQTDNEHPVLFPSEAAAYSMQSVALSAYICGLATESSQLRNEFDSLYLKFLQQHAKGL